MILSNTIDNVIYLYYLYLILNIYRKANSSLNEHQLTNTTSATESRKDYLVSCVYPAAQETRQLGSDTSFV